MRKGITIMKAKQSEPNKDKKKPPVVLTLDDIEEFETPEPLQLDSDDDFDAELDDE